MWEESWRKGEVGWYQIDGAFMRSSVRLGPPSAPSHEGVADRLGHHNLAKVEAGIDRKGTGKGEGGGGADESGGLATPPLFRIPPPMRMRGGIRNLGFRFAQFLCSKFGEVLIPCFPLSVVLSEGHIFL